jgi:hypothetical protein
VAETERWRQDWLARLPQLSGEKTA